MTRGTIEVLLYLFLAKIFLTGGARQPLQPKNYPITSLEYRPCVSKFCDVNPAHGVVDRVSLSFFFS